MEEMRRKRISVIIPAYNEENAIGHVLKDLPLELLDEVVVVNNGSTDHTARVAKNHGATVLEAKDLGYGNACLTGISYYLNQARSPDILVFLDGDYSDYPEQLVDLVQPILDKRAELVIGSRALGNRSKGSMNVHQIFGNWLATYLIRLFYGVAFTDLGPFRAISFKSLIRLNMKDQNYGWTVEMQLKAAKMNLSCLEVPVNYRNRIGFSKVSGTIKGSIMAGYKILFTIFRYL